MAGMGRVVEIPGMVMVDREIRDGRGWQRFQVWYEVTGMAGMRRVVGALPRRVVVDRESSR